MRAVSHPAACRRDARDSPSSQPGWVEPPSEHVPAAPPSYTPFKRAPSTAGIAKTAMTQPVELADARVGLCTGRRTASGETDLSLRCSPMPRRAKNSRQTLRDSFRGHGRSHAPPQQCYSLPQLIEAPFGAPHLLGSSRKGRIVLVAHRFALRRSSPILVHGGVHPLQLHGQVSLLEPTTVVSARWCVRRWRVRRAALAPAAWVMRAPASAPPSGHQPCQPCGATQATHRPCARSPQRARVLCAPALCALPAVANVGPPSQPRTRQSGSRGAAPRGGRRASRCF